MRKISSLMLVITMILNLCACGNGASDDHIKAVEVQLGDNISLDFAEMTIGDFAISDELEIKMSSNSYTHISGDSEEYKVAYLTGKIKNLHTEMIGGTMGSLDCLFGSVCFNDKYNYNFSSIISSDGNQQGLLQPLATGDFYLYAKVPASVTEEITSCTIRFAFEENLTTIDTALSTGFDYETCAYQYAIKDVKIEQTTVTDLALGEIASTDLLDITLENAEFAYYAENTIDDAFLTSTDNTDTIYSASMGNCLVLITYTMTNKDRGGSIHFNGGSDHIIWKLKYGEETYKVKGHDLNVNEGNSTLDFAPSAIINKQTGELIESHLAHNFILSAGETVTLRVLGIINTEPKTLNDGFELIVAVPTSTGEYANFSYTIPTKQ